MPTAIFVALQCCQCSTMQVKQRKKSSNKWTCVVCNQKQSVLKVFAQGPMAKDVRKFVQSFNISRKFTDQNQQSLDPASEYDIEFDCDDSGDLENPKKRRTDWTEYLDSEDTVQHGLALPEEDHVDLEPEIVTELPAKERFKRPKLRNYDDKGEDSDHQQLYKPVLSKTKRNSSRKETMFFSQGNIKDSTSDCKPATTAAKGNSKWKDYITEDDDHCFGRTSADSTNKWGEDAVLETESTEIQIVEDDIHPDFL